MGLTLDTEAATQGKIFGLGRRDNKIMKVLLLLLASLVMQCYGSNMKKELKIKNTCSNPLFSVPVLTDRHGGAVDRNSLINAVLEGRQDTSDNDPFSQVSEVKVFKWAIFGYVKIPDFIMDKVGQEVEKQSQGKIKYHSGGKFESNCIFKPLYGHCLPPKGRTNFRIDHMDKYADEVKKHIGSLANGFIKIQLTSTAAGVFNTEIFCLELEVKISINNININNNLIQRAKVLAQSLILH